MALRGAVCRLERSSRRPRHAGRRISRAPDPESAYNLAGASTGRPRPAPSASEKNPPGNPSCRSRAFDRSGRSPPPLAVALAALAPSPLGAVAAPALRRGARLRRHLPRGAGAVRVGALPRRAGAGPAAAERARSAASAGAGARPTSTTAANSAATPRTARRSTAAQPLFNQANSATIAQVGALAGVVAGRPRHRRAGPDAARQPGLLRRARRAGHARHHPGQQGGDRRAARLGQAQLRGRHRHHHRHPRGAGALRPGDGAGDRRRERPA